jgi:hypothetical protein
LNRSRRSSIVALSLLVVIAPGSARAAPPAPAGPHPRIALDAATLAALTSRAKTPGTAIHDAIVACEKAATNPGSPSGYQGDAWAFGASACALAYQVTRAPAHAARGLALLRALLEDVGQIGDGKACVEGSAPERAIAAIRRDTGYAIRFIGPHAALAYDWLHDAPGMTEALRQQSRDCFRAWIDWYSTGGYLRGQPGANYHAGFVLAKTLAAIATSGEGRAGASARDDDPGARQWREVIDEIFANQIVANGLAGDTGGFPQGGHHGVLVGGDWPEGWQYGPLSVIEYALAARALEQRGVSFPEVRAWTDDLVLRFLHGLTPAGDQSYIGGDVENEGPTIEANAGPLVATLLGPSGPRAAGWAAALRRRPALVRYGVPVFDALAEARGAAPIDPYTGAPPRWFLARGTRNLYARSDWGRGAFWSVFTSAPRQVDDHQHVDASNFVFSRGADALIVDPSPYGSRSSLTGNALTVDSDVVGPRYQPSQTPWSTADLPWARSTVSGVVAARADVAGAFAFAEQASDVSLARRDWVFLPEGEVVVIDRAHTADRNHRLRLRFRTSAPLALAAGLARGKIGGSALAIHPVALSPAAAPTVAAIPAGGDCDDERFGACTVARFAVGQYAVDLAGPDALAVHAIDALAAGEAPASVKSVNDPSIAGAAGAAGSADSADHNRAVVGAAVTRGAQTSYVVAAAKVDAAGSPRPSSSALAYVILAPGPSRQVVFDAPEDGQGRAKATATAVAGGRCRITLTAGGAQSMAGRPLVFTVGAAAAGCAVAEDPPAPMDGDHTTGVPGAPPRPRARPRADDLQRLWHLARHLPHKKALLGVGALFGVGLVGLAFFAGRARGRSNAARPRR